MTSTFPSSAPPAVVAIGPVAWLRKNLFSNWFNSILTIVLLFILGNALITFVQWAFAVAQWEVVPANLPLFFTGRFPRDQHWRLWIILAIITSLSGLTWGNAARNVPRLFNRNLLIGLGIAALVALLMPTTFPLRLLLLGIVVLFAAMLWAGQKLGRTSSRSGTAIAISWPVLSLFVLWLLEGGFGLKDTPTNTWGGLLLTLFVSIVSILLCFPLGVSLALGRQSRLPIIRWLSIFYIELIRGVPLIAILFIGQNMIPLFLPAGVRPDNIIRAIIGLTLFSAAYLAENVRGGLQSVPRGQVEAANALGLNPVLTTAFIVLPQALKVSIPAIVGQFISLFQDTTLLSIVAVVELLGISRSILANPNFIGRYWEVYIFIGLIYWLFCYSMSWGSRRLEQQLNTGR